jgi:hypothetical protein
MEASQAYLHCGAAPVIEKEKSCEPAVLQLLFALGVPTVRRFVVPPEPNPVASDMVSRNCVPLANGNCEIEYEPLPLLNADDGTDILSRGLRIWEV